MQRVHQLAIDVDLVVFHHGAEVSQVEVGVGALKRIESPVDAVDAERANAQPLRLLQGEPDARAPVRRGDAGDVRPVDQAPVCDCGERVTEPDEFLVIEGADQDGATRDACGEDGRGDGLLASAPISASSSVTRRSRRGVEVAQDHGHWPGQGRWSAYRLSAIACRFPVLGDSSRRRRADGPGFSRPAPPSASSRTTPRPVPVGTIIGARYCSAGTHQAPSRGTAGMPDWKDTVNLPRTDFPMKANLPGDRAGGASRAGTRRACTGRSARQRRRRARSSSCTTARPTRTATSTSATRSTRC